MCSSDLVRGALPSGTPDGGTTSGVHADLLADGPRGTDGVDAAASAWNGMLVVRLLAADGASLRRAVMPLLSILRDGRPMPRVWLC